MAVGLDIAEVELSIFTRQCLNRRIPDLETLPPEATAWAGRHNVGQAGVDRQFTHYRGCVHQVRASSIRNIRKK